ncbi:oxidoreductase [Diaporthe sp. PMI_573]|nr:oxidoreductase [Diaporthaceae sp. PMI_573]
MANTSDPKFREAKSQQGGADVATQDLFRLDDRTIIVTGGAGYLGVEVSGAILESGGDVVSVDIFPSPPAELWSKLQVIANKHNRNLSYYQMDITKEQNVFSAFADLVHKLRYPIRGLVACAGVSDNGPAVEFSVERFRRLTEINLVGTFTVAQAVTREMQKADVGGSMVLVASMSGTVVDKGVDTAAYNSSKSGILQLGRSLVAEWGSRIGMPLIRWTGDNMLYRLSYVDEFRAPVLFLLGDGSSFMTAADLRVDGGYCAW